MGSSKSIYTLKIKNFNFHQARQYWRDVLLVVVIAVAAGFASYYNAQMINPVLILDKQTTDTWFHSDMTRVFDDMAIYHSGHNRTNVHPLFVLIAFPLVYVVKTAFWLEPITAVQIVIAAVAALWFSLLFILLRLLGCRQFDATLFSILAATSAAAVFWFVIPETYPFGSLSILLALSLVALAPHRQSPWWHVVVSALTLSFTITNWMVGILATVVNYRWKKSLQITFAAFTLVAVLVVVQKVVFPSFNAGFLRVIPTVTEEVADVFEPGSGSETGVPLQVVKSFVFDTMVMPSIQLVDNIKFPAWSRMTIQTSPIGSGSPWGKFTVLLWTALLSLGLWGLFSIKKHLQLRIVLGLALLGQLTLHMIYGLETFLYSLHFLPLLIILAALSTLTRARLLALVLAGTLVLSAGANNGLQFSKIIEFSHGHGPLCNISAKCGVDSKVISSP